LDPVPEPYSFPIYVIGCQREILALQGLREFLSIFF
jgi:hypothetical protein